MSCIVKVQFISRDIDYAYLLYKSFCFSSRYIPFVCMVWAQTWSGWIDGEVNINWIEILEVCILESRS